jgi:hypothetical protein
MAGARDSAWGDVAARAAGCLAAAGHEVGQGGRARARPVSGEATARGTGGSWPVANSGMASDTAQQNVGASPGKHPYLPTPSRASVTRTMVRICPATGHVIDPHSSAAAFCPDHGVRLFQDCSKCGEPWPVTTKQDAFDYSDETYPTDGNNFCDTCGTPAPWLTREQKMTWIRHQLQASRDIDPATRDELVEVIGRLQGMAPGDSKAIPGWEKIKTRAPKVWEVVRPVLVSIVSGEVKKLLGL